MCAHVCAYVPGILVVMGVVCVGLRRYSLHTGIFGWVSVGVLLHVGLSGVAHTALWVQLWGTAVAGVPGPPILKAPQR